MRISLTLLDRASRRDVDVDADEATPVREVLQALAVPPDAPLFDGSTSVPPASTFGQAGLRSGAVLTTGPGRDLVDRAGQGHLLRIVGGPGSGAWLPLRLGTWTVGRDQDCDLFVPDPAVSSHHLTLTVEPNGITVTDTSRNGTLVGADAAPSGARVAVQPGQPIRIGDATLEIAPVPPLDGAVTPGPEGKLLFNRVTQQPADVHEADIALPTPPPTLSSGGMMVQLLSSGGMILAAVVAAILFGRPQLLIISVLGPITFLIAGQVQRSGVRRQGVERQETYGKRRAAAFDEAGKTAVQQETQLRSAAPDLSALLLTAYGRRSTLWSRDAANGLPLRLGLHERPAVLRMSGGDPEEPVGVPTLNAVPFVLRLDESQVLGIAGDSRATALARALVLQLAVLLPPSLQIVFLSGRPDSAAWAWLRWLPHVGKPGALAIGNTPASARQRVKELTAVIESRLEMAGTYGRQRSFPPLVVVLDGASQLRAAAPDVLTVMQQGPAVAVYVLAVDDATSGLPAEARTKVSFPDVESAELLVERLGATPVTGIRADLLGSGFAERAARCLAPLVPLGGTDDTGLPDTVRFLDLVGFPERPEDASAWVATQWSTGRAGRAVIGVDQSQDRVAIDLRTDGPHGLVVGTTGAGKSEFLRTLVGGLVLSDAPHRLNLLLVDFKGGGAFGRLEHLPHVVGLATDLNIRGVLADRLLASLRREMTRRKELFNQAQVSELKDYPDQPPGSPAAVPRLVVIVDEFAELKEAQPDFIDGLVQIATIGRTLGIHLLLATQRPQGVISPQIRDNAQLRIALRVFDTVTSSDVVGVPDAAAFPKSAPGRLIVSSGNDARRTVQAGYISGGAPGDKGTLPPPRVVDVPWQRIGEPADQQRRAEGTSGATDLELLVDAVRRAAAQHGLAAPRRPWLPPLPELLTLEQFPPGLLATDDGIAVPIVAEDLPAQQRQDAMALQLGGGSLAILGGGRSGRTTALRGVAASVAQRLGPDDVHLHVVDFGVEAGLLPVTGLPHSGVYLRGMTDLPRLRRLISRLGDEVEQRGRTLSRLGYGSLGEWRNKQPEGAPPFLLLLLDGWEAFTTAVESEPDNLRQRLLRLLAEGRPAGLQAVVTGGRGLVAGSTASSFETIVGLPFEQRDDYNLLGLRPTTLPDEIPPGRAYRASAGTAVQFPLLAPDRSASAQRAAFEQIAATARSQWPAPLHEPLRLDELRSMPLAEALALTTPDPGQRDPVLLGIGGDRLRGRTVDLAAGRPALLVVGPAGSGRSTALRVLAAQLAEAGRPVRLLGSTDDVPAPEDLRGVAVLVDDAGRNPAQDPWLEALLGGHDGPLVLAADLERFRAAWGWAQTAKHAAAILLLTPHRTYDGDAIGVAVAAGQTFRGPAGRGLLQVRGRTELVQVPDLAD